MKERDGASSRANRQNYIGTPMLAASIPIFPITMIIFIRGGMSDRREERQEREFIVVTYMSFNFNKRMEAFGF